MSFILLLARIRIFGNFMQLSPRVVSCQALGVISRMPPFYLVDSFSWQVADLDFSVLYALTASNLSVDTLFTYLNFGEVWANAVEYSGGGFKYPITFKQVE